MGDRHPEMSGLAAAGLSSGLVVALAAIGWFEPALATPPIGAPAELVAWWVRSGPVLGAVVLLRLGGIASGACLDAVILAPAIARWTQRVLVQVPSRIVLAGRAQGLSVLAAGALAAQPVAVAAGVACPAPSSPSTQASACSASGTSVVVTPGPGGARSSPAGLEPPPVLSPAGATPQSRTSAPVPRAALGRPRRASGSVYRPAPVQMWTVAPGESFWSIAEAVVGKELTTSGPRAHAAELSQSERAGREQEAVARYWVALVAANLDRLPVRGDPDVLYVGDRVVLPPLD